MNIDVDRVGSLPGKGKENIEHILGGIEDFPFLIYSANVSDFSSLEQFLAALVSKRASVEQGHVDEVILGWYLKELPDFRQLTRDDVEGFRRLYLRVIRERIPLDEHNWPDAEIIGLIDMDEMHADFLVSTDTRYVFVTS